MHSPATHLLVTFLRTHPAWGHFPGQTVLVEMAPARVLVADGFAVPADPVATSMYARPAAATDERAVMPAFQPTAKPTSKPSAKPVKRPAKN